MKSIGRNDTGCCFGGHLTAVMFNEPGWDIVQVKAKQKYAAGHGDE